MNALTNLPLWPWLAVIGALASAGAALLAAQVVRTSRYNPARSRFSIGTGFVTGAALAIGVGVVFQNVIAMTATALLVGYLATRQLYLRSDWLVPDPFESGANSPGIPTAPQGSVTRVPLRPDWNHRPRYETLENGLFVGREELLERLAGDFTARSSGTVLISGVRGVGKTSLVERALLAARERLQNAYWDRLRSQLAVAPFWRFDWWLRWVLGKMVWMEPATPPGSPSPPPVSPLRRAAEQLVTSPLGRIHPLRPIAGAVQRLTQAAGSQLLVLKFDASDISGAMADPQPAPDPQAPAGKPQVNPEKLMRALIRKLHSTCHPSQPTMEARVLQWSLRDKRQRREFFDRLAAAYQKSVSKSYKETVSDSFRDALKESQSRTYELKLNLERIFGLVVALAVGVAVAWFWPPAGVWIVTKYIAGGAATVAAYGTLAFTIKRSRERTRDSDRQSAFSYEFDYSLAQMEADIKAMLNVLSVTNVPENAPFDRRRCFVRVVMVFDELDKLENPVEQLNNVITHFKNFFTLSDALFVFITDHQFYEHLCAESLKAQRLRQYSTEHTFFTNRIYLRKPEFGHFYEAVYGSCLEPALIDTVVRPAAGRVPSTDAGVLEFVLRRNPGLRPVLAYAPLPALTYLMLALNRFSAEDQESVRKWFQSSGGNKDPFALATLWAGLVGTDREADYHQAFADAGGWEHPASVALLFHHRSAFSEADRPEIDRHYLLLKSPSVARYTGVDTAPFTLSDIARALCFQSRNHYFDLFYLIHDYVGSYDGGVPVLHVDESRFGREQRLWSRYQQMAEAAFLYRREQHPSREYWNAQLMETLYCVFDSRLNGDKVRIGSVTYAAPKAVAATPPAQAENAAPDEIVAPAAPVEAISPITPRDIEYINQAVLRLLRLLVARHAVRVPPTLEERLFREDNLKLADIADQEFEWQPDCESEITQEGIGIEPYEQSLIDFWDNNRIDIESIEQEILHLWKFSTLPATSAAGTLRAAIQRLRATADGLRGRSATISHPDANALLAHFARLDTFADRVPDLFNERILDDGDTVCVAAAARKDPHPDREVQLALSARAAEIETLAQTPLRTLLLPRPSQAMGYLLAGAAAAEFHHPLANVLQPWAHVYFYAPGPELVTPANLEPELTVYCPTRAGQFLSDLFNDYSRFASAARIATIATYVRDARFANKTYNLALGSEILKRSDDASDVYGALCHPTVAIAASGIVELVGRTPTAATFSVYGMTPTIWSAEAYQDAVIRTITARFGPNQPPFDLALVLKFALSSMVPEDAQKTFESFQRALGDPTVAMRVFLKALLDWLIGIRVPALGLNDDAMHNAVRAEIVPWIVAALEAIAKEKGVELAAAPAQFPTWSSDFEMRRRQLKLAPVATSASVA